MTRRINTLINTQWLLPLFNEQLNELHQLWRNGYETSDIHSFEYLHTSYHDIASSLDVASLTVFSYLARGIEAFLKAIAEERITITEAPIALYASELLQYELNNYTKTGDYQEDLIIRRCQYLLQLLKQHDVDTTHVETISARLPSTTASNITNNSQADKPDTDSNQDKAKDSQITIDSAVDDNNNNEQYSANYLSNNLNIPKVTSSQRLSQSQFESLTVVWRYGVQHLLKTNDNVTATLQKLVKVARYLRMDAGARDASSSLQALWYMTELWLTELADNEEPKPAIYAHILSNIDTALSQGMSSKNSVELINALLVDIYIHLRDLETVSTTTKTVIDSIKQSRDYSKGFLPHVLDELERLIFMLDTPNKVIKPLQQIQTQLKGRGWYVYEQQVEQVLQELYAVEQMPEIYNSTRWQIERQLQELYGTMFNSVETINEKIGQGQLSTSFQTIKNEALGVEAGTSVDIDNQKSDSSHTNRSTDSSIDIDTNLSAEQIILQSDGQFPTSINQIGKQVSITSNSLDMTSIRTVRIAVEDIKTAFSHFLQSHSLGDLPQVALFDTLKQTFSQMQLYDVVDVVEQCQRIFDDIAEYQLTKLNWQLTDTIADGLAILELFLDYLAQQTLDLSLLNEALERFESARTLLVELSLSPKLAEDTLPLLSSATSDVMRYDDTGDIKPQPTDINLDEDILADSNNGQFQELVFDDEASEAIDNIDNVINQDQATQEQDTSDTLITSNNQIVSDTDEQLSDTPELQDSPELQKAREMLKDDNFDMDEDIKEIFIEEADEVLEELEIQLPVWQKDILDLTPLNEIRRGFHTLKGSGRMVGAFNAAELAWAVENLLNRVLDKTLPVSNELVTFIRDTKDLIPTLVEDFANERLPSIDPAITIAQANNLINGNQINQGIASNLIASSDISSAQSDSIVDSDNVNSNNVNNNNVDNDTSTQEKTEQDELESNDIFQDLKPDEDENEITATSVNTSETSLANQASEPTDLEDRDDNSSSQTEVTATISLPPVLQNLIDDTEIPEDDEEADEDIKEIFIEEAEEVLEDIIPIFKQWRADRTDDALLGEIRRGFHTLKGSGRMVGAFYSGELAWAIEGMLNRILDNSIEAVPDVISLIDDVLQTYPKMVETFAKGSKDYPDVTLFWVACAQAYSKGKADEFDYASAKQAWLTSPAHEDNNNEGLETVQAQEQPKDSELDISATFEASEAITEVSSDAILDTLETANEKLAEANLPIPAKDDEDWEFYDIFLEEATGLVAIIKDFIHNNEHNREIVVNDEVVRAFHTLRGAAGSDALKEVSKISATVENSLKLLQQHEASMNQNHLQVLEKSVNLIEQCILQFKEGVSKAEENDDVASIDSTQDSDAVQKLMDESFSDQRLTEDEYDIEQIISDDIETLLDAQWEVASHLSQDNDEAKRYAIQLIQEIENLSIRVTKSPKFTRLLTALHEAYHKLAEQPELVSNNASSAAQSSFIINTLVAGHNALTQLFDSLAGSMSLQLDDKVIRDLNGIVSSTFEDDLASEANPTVSLTDNATGAIPQTTSEKDVAPVATPVSADKVTAKVAPLDIEPITTDIELLEIFLEEAQELDDSIHEEFAKWRQNPEDLESLKVLQRHLHTVKGGARMAGISSIGDLTHEAETIYELFVKGTLTPDDAWVDVMQQVQDVLSQQIDYVLNNHESFYLKGLIKQVIKFAQDRELPEQVKLDIPTITEKEDVKVEPSTLARAEDEEQLEDNNITDAKFQKLIVSSWGSTLPDEDILSVFLEEANEIVDSSSEQLRVFRSNTSDLSVLKQLQRELHTIKGGARMVPANGIADLAHQMETVYEDLASRRRPATKMVGQLLEACHDWLASAVTLLEYKINPPFPSQLIEALKRFSKNPDSLSEIKVDSLQFYQEAIKEHDAHVNSRTELYSIDTAPPMVGNFSKTQDQTTLSSEMIRISATLMESMINLSGESAINRARIDMGITSLTNTIEEMGVTVQRLADQLRRMDIELEAQILAQIDDEELLGKADFDPLEMDQYSALNQLSKSLSESASDLLDIKTTMIDKTRDAEGLLLQLSRTQAELQDGLMNSRMVPFSRLTPRLQRIVRQTANELNKSVELKIVNADDEMDRTILERITSPLEHMLRNAVDHGIEPPKVREQLGKPRTGLIELEVLREGSEVVIHLSDDGAGINVDAVRKKAISQGLIDPNDTSLTDLDVMQYIFNAGLTTTNKVTQISGRGVGMDVVLNEIRQLGGIVSVESKANGGSIFSMRVPLTVAVSDALVVRVADSYYAIPLVQIERVVRVNPERLYDYYQSDNSTFEIDGLNYRLRHLNEILRGTGLNQLAVNTNLSLPVIIVKNQTDQQLAIQVDEVAGSRIEVVVKPLGRQLSHASGISAATIMADGSVMLILDLMALLRNAPARTQITVGSDDATSDNSQQSKTILIVDDSVTVRKVTSRLLERQGYITHVAKDGIDAIEILQDLTPDLMLLDIEMPRMDGFEVATQVRHDSRLKDIPIIMITSRTGDKHRERAFDIGVNDYMGKPFQEAQLLQTVANLLGQNVHE